jgi:GNAT superfamily N-acetyltransferase
VLEGAKLRGEKTFEISEDASSDNPDVMSYLEKDGYIRGEKYGNRYYRQLSKPIPAPILPPGYTVRSIDGETEAAARAALQRDAFYPHTSPTYEIATERQLAAMAMPHYDPRLDLMVIAPDGTLAAGCICWTDPVNQIGLFEPVGTRSQFRRQGLATALMQAGLQRLHDRGMQAALVTGIHPGDEAKNTEFSSSRYVYEAVGFELLRKTYTYSKMVSVL